MQKFLTSSILTIIIKTFGYHIFLGDLVQLANTISQDSVSSGRKSLMRRVIDIVEIVHHEFYLVLVGDGSGESLELQFLDLLDFSITYAFDDCTQGIENNTLLCWFVCSFQQLHVESSMFLFYSYAL